MKLTRFGFELLVLLNKRGPGRYTQKQLAEQLNISVGSVNKLLHQFTEDGAIRIGEDKRIYVTDIGLQLLEPYRVKKAIIVAAGFSERLAPVSLETPKPLVTVNGVRIIDTLIDALIAAEIRDISVVTGHKAEKFSALCEKYPEITLIKNPLYNRSGNITSLYAAVDQIDRCYICDADLYIRNPDIISTYEYTSCFFGVPVAETDDWCFTVSGQRIKNIGIGGEKCHRAIFIMHLNEEDSARAKEDISSLIATRGGKEHRWFDPMFGETGHHYSFEPKSCYSDDVFEVDTLEDLIVLDSSYSKYEGF